MSAASLLATLLLCKSLESSSIFSVILSAPLMPSSSSNRELRIVDNKIFILSLSYGNREEKNHVK
eukprot:6046136-Amphidinium_carterae.1